MHVLMMCNMALTKSFHLQSTCCLLDKKINITIQTCHDHPWTSIFWSIPISYTAI